MNLLEHEAKTLLSRMGIKVPKGKVVGNEDELRTALLSTGLPAILKAQVPTGGRGKAGAIVKVDLEEEAAQALKDIFDKTVRGHQIESVLVEEFVPHQGEIYLALAIDRGAGRPVIMYGKGGGMDVESKGGQIRRVELDPLIGPNDDLAQEVALELGLIGKGAKRLTVLIFKIWSFFVGYDCELVEVNPLVSIRDELVCLDAKVVINDDSIFRHEDLGLDRNRGKSPFEIACDKKGLTGVELNGEVAVVANGAGLTMAVLDELDMIGLAGAGFIDLGGTDDPSRIADAILLMMDYEVMPRAKGILICVFGGITRCDVVARGIVDSLSLKGPRVPLSIRLRGVNEVSGRDILRGAGLDAYEDLEEACLGLMSAMKEGRR